MRRTAWGWQAVLVVATTLTTLHDTSAQPVEPVALSGVTFSAEVTVERTVVDERGRVTRALPRSRYRVERFRDGRSRMTMLTTTAEPRVGPMADVYSGVAVDIDASGAMHILGKDGRPLPGAPALARDLLPPGLGDEADNGLVAAASDSAARQRDLTRAFGPRAGSVRRLERYLARSGNRVHEVLVAPATALPVEVNVVTDGHLEEHHEFEYEARQDGQWVRTRARSESRLPGAANERMVAVTTLSNVRLTGGAR